MSSCISSLDNGLKTVGEAFESMFRVQRNLGEPQYKYFTVPIYKACVEKVGKVAATGISFLAADLVLHQAVPQTLICLSSYVLSPIIPDSIEEYLGLDESCNLSYSYEKTLFWAAFAIPVMYAKYKRSN